MVDSLYKLIAKVLAQRLGDVTNKLISHNKLVFLQRRVLVDGVAFVNEVIDMAKRSKKECLIFKVDLEKAYD